MRWEERRRSKQYYTRLTSNDTSKELNTTGTSFAHQTLEQPQVKEQSGHMSQLSMEWDGHAQYDY